MACFNHKSTDLFIKLDLWLRPCPGFSKKSRLLIHFRSDSDKKAKLRIRLHSCSVVDYLWYKKSTKTTRKLGNRQLLKRVRIRPKYSATVAFSWQEKMERTNKQANLPRLIFTLSLWMLKVKQGSCECTYYLFESFSLTRRWYRTRQVYPWASAAEEAGAWPP